MCAISGIVAENAVFDGKLRISRMTDSMVHRGPDGTGVVSFGSSVFLGHNRLKIVDLSDFSSQPMISSSGRYAIVFNGEIYNYLEIREQIPSYPYKTTGDTEVILAALECKGLAWFLERANGMFSIGIYDLLEKSLTLIRDRLGVKPLYYYHGNKTFIFASEPKGILASGLVEAVFNDNVIDSYLANRYVPAPETFFVGIKQLSAGSMGTLKDDGIFVEKKYWCIPEHPEHSEFESEAVLVDELENILRDAVKLRLRSDVPVGSFLSGGVDSSLITAMAAEIIDEPIHTFSIGFGQDGFDELPYALKVSKIYKTVHSEIGLGKDEYFGSWMDAIRFRDAPLGVPNEVALALLAKHLKKYVTVVLSGEGADELFGGYGRIFRFSHDYSAELGSFAELFQKEYEYVPREFRDSILASSGIHRRALGDRIVADIFEKYGYDNGIQHFFHEYHLKGLLARLDSTTMQSSVEARGPFLDYRLVDFSYRRVPFEYKVRWNSEEMQSRAKGMRAVEFSEVYDTPKYLLKKVAERYLPLDVIYRKKMGFPVPLNGWIDELNSKALVYIENAPWIKPGKVKEIAEFCKQSPRGGQILWMLLNVEMFRKEYFERSWRW